MLKRLFVLSILILIGCRAENSVVAPEPTATLIPVAVAVTSTATRPPAPTDTPPPDDLPLSEATPPVVQPEQSSALRVDIDSLSGPVDAFFVAEPYVYTNFGDQFVVLDATNPAPPQTVGSVSIPELAARQDYIYVADIFVADGLAYVSAFEAGLFILDVSDPTAPVVVAHYQPPLPGWSDFPSIPSPEPPRYLFREGARSVVIQRVDGRTLAYVAAYAAGLRVLDVTDPANPSEVGTVEFTLPAAPVALVIEGNYAYVATGKGGLRVLNLTNPLAPQEISSSENELFWTWDVAFQDNKVYLAEGYCDGLMTCPGGLRVVDVSDPANLEVIRNVSELISQRVNATGDQIDLLVSTQLQSFDAVSPEAPLDVWYDPLPVLLKDMARVGDYIYLASAGEGLQIITLNDSDTPVKAIRFPPAPVNPYFTNYGPREGLLGNVSAVLTTQDGTVWAGASGGLHRFDGTAWQPVDPFGGERSEPVAALARTISGDLWVGYSIPIGASRFDGQSWTNYIIGDTYPGNQVNDIAIDGNDHVWLATGYGLLVYDGQTWQRYLSSQTESRDLPPFIDNVPNSIVVPVTEVELADLPSNHIEALAVDPLNRVWVGTPEGLATFDGQRMTIYDDVPNLRGQWIAAIAAERLPDSQAGRVWVATIGQGVVSFEGQTVTSHTTTDGLASDAVYAIHIEPGGRKWFGTNAGVSLFDNDAWYTFTSVDGLVHDWVFAIDTTQNGEAWLGTDGGLSRFVPPTNLADFAAPLQPSIVHPAGTVTGIAEIERVIEAVFNRDGDTLMGLVQFTTINCTTVEGLGGPPKCQGAETEGTPVEVLPVAYCEGTYIRPEHLSPQQFDLDTSGGGRLVGLYAVYRPKPPQSEESFWPVGEYGIVFVTKVGGFDSAVTIRLTGNGGIIGISYGCNQAPADEIARNAAELILPPVTDNQ